VSVHCEQQNGAMMGTIVFYGGVMDESRLADILRGFSVGDRVRDGEYGVGTIMQITNNLYLVRYIDKPCWWTFPYWNHVSKLTHYYEPQ